MSRMHTISTRVFSGLAAVLLLAAPQVCRAQGSCTLSIASPQNGADVQPGDLVTITVRGTYNLRLAALSYELSFPSNAPGVVLSSVPGASFSASMTLLSPVSQEPVFYSHFPHASADGPLRMTWFDDAFDGMPSGPADGLPPATNALIGTFTVQVAGPGVLTVELGNPSAASTQNNANGALFSSVSVAPAASSVTFFACSTVDCNGNGVGDDCDISTGSAPDCNGNLVPDSCDIAAGTSTDCNENTAPDECDIAAGYVDCNHNEILDHCETDCNGNLQPDDCDISTSASQDCNANGVPDECETLPGGNPATTVAQDGCLDAQFVCPPGIFIPVTYAGSNENSLPNGQLHASCVPPIHQGHDVFYRYVPAHDGILILSTCGSSFDTILSIHENCDPTGAEYACNDDMGSVCGFQDLDSSWTGWSVSAGVNYIIRVAGKDFDTGAFVLYVEGPSCLPAGGPNDCNTNARPDDCDIASGESQDCDQDGIPDECAPDCNGNSVPDGCDIAAGTSSDCNQNAYPDECELTTGNPLAVAGQDECDDAQAVCPGVVYSGTTDNATFSGSGGLQCGTYGDPDVWYRYLPAVDGTVSISTCGSTEAIEVSFHTAGSFYHPCMPGGSPNTALACDNIGCAPMFGGEFHDIPVLGGKEYFIRLSGPEVQTGTYTVVLTGPMCQTNECNGNGILDECDIAAGASQDCNGNVIPDDCELLSGSANDCDFSGVPDECEADCNGNKLHDDCDLDSGSSSDCNGNGVPDECDIAGPVSKDCNHNDVPDECDIANGTSSDNNHDGRPDECPRRILPVGPITPVPLPGGGGG